MNKRNITEKCSSTECLILKKKCTQKNNRYYRERKHTKVFLHDNIEEKPIIYKKTCSIKIKTNIGPGQDEQKTKNRTRWDCNRDTVCFKSFRLKKKLRKYNLKISDSGEILEGPSRSIHMAIPNKAVPNAGSIEQLV